MTSPNGVLPVPNAVVYVPNAPVAAFTTNVQCESCATPSGSPLIATQTDANGHFLLPNMPVSIAGKVTDIPVVVQLGRWRKQFTVTTTACTNTLVPAYAPGTPANKTAALPSTKAEGDIPLTAISTGSVDGLECVFRKMGVADSEFTDGNGNGRIRLYQDNGARISASSPKAAVLYGLPASNASGNVSGATNASPIVITTSAAHGLSTGAIVTVTGVKGNTAANGAWTITVVSAIEFSLQGSTGNANVHEEMERGARARALATARSTSTTPPSSAASAVRRTRMLDRARTPALREQGRTRLRYAFLVRLALHREQLHLAVGGHGEQVGYGERDRVGEHHGPGSMSAFIDTYFAKGALFANWLQAPVGTTSASYPPPYSPVDAVWKTSPAGVEVALTEPRRVITPQAPNMSTSGVISPAERWIYSTPSSTVFAKSDPAAENAPMHYTFNTPWGGPKANQCGRVLFSGFHVSIGNTQDKIFPAECNNSPLTSQEKVLAYMLFDLASCVSTSEPPVCKPKKCSEQGIGCGLAGDGCGGQLDCGDCPLGKTCGGGGVASQCGAPACTPKQCDDGAVREDGQRLRRAARLRRSAASAHAVAVAPTCAARRRVRRRSAPRRLLDPCAVQSRTAAAKPTTVRVLPTCRA